MIRITSYGVIAEKPRVGQLGRFLRAPGRKNYALDRKTNDTFLMNWTSSIDRQSLGNIVQCAPAAGAKMWCLSVFFCLFVTPGSSRAAR